MSQAAPAPRSMLRKVAYEAVVGGVLGAALWVAWHTFSGRQLPPTTIWVWCVGIAYILGTLAVFRVERRPALPHFSLRLLLLAVAVLCAWLAWERSVVIERRAALEELRRDPEVMATSGMTSITAVFIPTDRRFDGTGGGVSWIRQAFGDERIRLFHFPEPFDPRPERIHELFPEAGILVGHRGGVRKYEPQPGDPLPP